MKKLGLENLMLQPISEGWRPKINLRISKGCKECWILKKLMVQVSFEAATMQGTEFKQKKNILMFDSKISQ